MKRYVFLSICMASFLKANNIGPVLIEDTKSQDIITNQKPNEQSILAHKLKQKSATLGDALDGEISIHANTFGGGSSAPVIRGQEGIRVKIAQNSGDVFDMSELSHDHSIGVNSLNADEIQILRGASTLAFSNASIAGVINVKDGKIPQEYIQESEANYHGRFNSNSKEFLNQFSFKQGFSEHYNFTFDFLKRKADDYKVKRFHLDRELDFVPDTHNKNTNFSFGSSYTGENGYFGLSYVDNKEFYGIPGHNHSADSWEAHIKGEDLSRLFWVLKYPHLMDEADIPNPHFHSGDDINTQAHSHDHPYGHAHSSQVAGPDIDMHSKSYTLQGALRNLPIQSIKAIEFYHSHTNYKHDEKDHGISVNLFENKGDSTRIQTNVRMHENLSGIFGFHLSKSKSSANIPRLKPCQNDQKSCKNTPSNVANINDEDRIHWALIPNESSKMALFSILNYKNDFLDASFGYRGERQKIDIDYDMDFLLQRQNIARQCNLSIFHNEKVCQNNIKHNKFPLPDLNPYKKIAHSVAIDSVFRLNDTFSLNLGYSHNQRHPSAMEMYYHGKHLASSSFRFGNKNLKKEISDNFELGISAKTDRLKIYAGAYANDFKNRIFDQILHKNGNLTINRYNQSKAFYYGFEFQAWYEMHKSHKIGLSGDYVEGILHDLPPLQRRDDILRLPYYIHLHDQYAPKVPPARLALTYKGKLTSNIQTEAKYTYNFTQNKTAPFEDKSPSSSVIDLSITYKKEYKSLFYEFYLKANNLLNENVYQHISALPFVPQMGRNFTIGIQISY